MAKTKPKTKAGKAAKVAKVMHEWGSGNLQSSSGAGVTKQPQAVAIALSEAGLDKPPAKRKGGGHKVGDVTKRLSKRLEQRLDARDRRNGGA